MSRPGRGSVSIQEARGAIYWDFEGSAPATRAGNLVAPTLSGILLENDFTQYVLESAFFGAVSYTSPSTPWALSPQTLSEHFEMVARRSRTDDRRIVAWSENELNLARDFASPTAFSAIEENYVNARRFATKWRRRAGIEFDEGGNSLDNFRDIFGLPRPTQFGGDQPAAWIKTVRIQLHQRDFDFNDLTQRARRKWTLLRKHNERDCRDTREVLLKVL